MPTAIPQGSKRAPRVTAGSANHIRAGLVGATGGDHRAGQQQRQQAPGARHPEPGPRTGLHEAIGYGEAAEADGERCQPEPADRRAGRGERQGENREAGGPVAPHALLHVEQAFATGFLADRRKRVLRAGLVPAGEDVTQPVRR